MVIPGAAWESRLVHMALIIARDAWRERRDNQGNRRHFRETDRDKETDRQTDRETERQRETEETLFYKDCRFGSVRPV